MFNLFRRLAGKQEAPATPQDFQGIYIDGNLYSRYGADIRMTTRDSDEVTIISEPGHTAPNGVSIQQIAYAIAMIEGFISIGSSGEARNPFSPESSGIGLN